ncbi:MAG: sigma-70 family RNA polymerase sigma factor [Acidobacteria bacterium]|nr:MAG: sigma-70 family RNA polymerase sigma factor [Acidobacteriota bacterium]
MQARERQRDLELAARLLKGDKAAVEELTREFGPMVHQQAFKYMKNWEDAEEVAQDVLLKVVRKIELFRGDSALSSWIYRITFNTAMSRLRNGRFSRPHEVLMGDLAAASNRGDYDEARMPAFLEPADLTHMGDEAVMRRQLREKVIAALREMPDVYRVPVVLRDLHGMSTEEASEVLQVKTQTLKSRLHRGRTFLRERLQEFAGGLTLHRPVEV